MLTTQQASQQAKFHKNVMENLVYEEIDRQLKHYPKTLAGYINPVEVATYALNRLPALYASSLNGQSQQTQIARRKYKEQIVSAVRRAIAAIERDPLRVSTPIASELEIQYDLSKKMLDDLQKLLKERNLLDYPNQEITWENAAGVMQKAFNKVEWTSSHQSSLPVPPLPPLPQRTQEEAARRREEIRNMGTLW